jgi:hypothetical protein
MAIDPGVSPERWRHSRPQPSGPQASSAAGAGVFGRDLAQHLAKASGGCAPEMRNFRR